MNYANLATALARNPAFIGSTTEQCGIWLKLMIFCTEQENGGHIKHCRAWTDAAWIRAAGLTRLEMAQDCELWHWSNDSLTVNEYNHKHEHFIQQKRRAAQQTNLMRWGNPEAKNRSASRSPDRSASRSPDRKKERKKEIGEAAGVFAHKKSVRKSSKNGTH